MERDHGFLGFQNDIFYRDEVTLHHNFLNVTGYNSKFNFLGLLLKWKQLVPLRVRIFLLQHGVTLNAMGERGLNHTLFRACKLKRCKRKSGVFYRLQNGCGCTRDSDSDRKDSIFIRIHELCTSVNTNHSSLLLGNRELSLIIAAGKLHCKINKVEGVLETNRPDAKNALYDILCF
ncbi:unnamed protein product [Lactuca saligna]|uniref:Uncharacterized protein n=1 Tax=Lactuca saligna TaxID=75948 RepID=A0AA35ZL22_LACSI|nr:unnamed protein product [Lactuca saligna]